MKLMINIILSILILILQLLGLLRGFAKFMAILTTIALLGNYYGTGHILKNILVMVIFFWGVLFLHPFLLNFFIGIQEGFNNAINKK